MNGGGSYEFPGVDEGDLGGETVTRLKLCKCDTKSHHSEAQLTE